MTLNHNTASVNKKLKLGLVLNTAFTAFEFIVGFFSGSLALISDAGHNLADSMSLVVTFFAAKFGDREADDRHSYGHERITIIAALFNASILVVLALYIFYSAVNRIFHPEPVAGGLVMAVAAFGIIINGSVALLFIRERDLHMRSAFLNMAFDTIASLGALVAGAFIYFFKQTIADPIISIGIGCMIIYSARGIIKDSINILLEGVPEGINLNAIGAAIKTVERIKEIDDLHIWSLSSHDIALSCHIVVENCDLSQSVATVKEVKKLLLEKFSISHATIEIELAGCESGAHK
ncbi:MAG: cation diffusion facilitator family transporter [bacterium]|nr:cation diffusion facilitator family transporter [bacterium]